MERKRTVRSMVSTHSLFSTLPKEACDELLKAISLQSYGKGQYFFFQGDDATSAYLILTGQVLLESISIDGGRFLFGELRKGDFFGEFALIDNGLRSTSAVAATDTTLISIPKSTLIDLINGHPEFAMKLLRRLVSLVRNADAHLEAMKFKNLGQKVAHYLVQEFVRNGSSQNDLDLTQAEIARAVSASREKVNKSIQYYKSKGILRTARGQVTILDIERLKSAYIDQ